MKRAIRLACLIALPLALAACGEKEPEAKAEAAGEILTGSINDAMLPMDSVRSQPPLAPQTQAAAKAGETKADANAATDATGEDGPTTDTSAAPLTPPTAKGTATSTPSPAAPTATQ